MATVDVGADRIRIRLTTAEKIAALHGDLDLPRTAVRGAEIVPDGAAATRGLRAPGLALPGLRKIGTWRSRAGAEFVSVRRGEAAVRLELTGQRYASVLVGVAEPAALVRSLER